MGATLRLLVALATGATAFAFAGLDRDTHGLLSVERAISRGYAAVCGEELSVFCDLASAE